MEAEIEAEILRRRTEAAEAIHYAIDHGATKTALRKVTTSDYRSFVSFVELGNEMARGDENS